MKTLTVLMALILIIAPSEQLLAFHEGGVANCDGCHIMHDKNGGSMNSYLLASSDQSSICLVCHSSSSAVPDSYKITTYPAPSPGLPPRQLSPGGDFAYLQKNYNWVTSGGTAKSSPGERHGHNIIANDFMYVKDSMSSYSPGGFYPRENLTCVSCHDPHGKYRILEDGVTQAVTGVPIGSSGSYGALPTGTKAVGVYRILGGAGYIPASLKQVNSSLAFGISTPAPVAVAPLDYNRAETLSDTRVAYGTGMSEWCGNCHATYLSGHSDSFRHPSGYSAKLQDKATEYNSYVKSYMYTGSFDNAYTSLIPFEEGTNNLNALVVSVSSSTGASASGNVMCITCHRAHASAWDRATRWNTATDTYLTLDGAYPGINAPTLEGQKGEYATGKTWQEYQQALYGRDVTAFAPDNTLPGTRQGSLCNKCHWNDSRKVLPE